MWVIIIVIQETEGRYFVVARRKKKVLYIEQNRQFQTSDIKSYHRLIACR